jgi:hypothetical protein
MPRVGFETTIPAFERTKTAHGLDRAAITLTDEQKVSKRETDTHHHYGHTSHNYSGRQEQHFHVSPLQSVDFYLINV